MMNTADKNEIHIVNWNELTEDAFSSILYQFLYSKYFHLLLAAHTHTHTHARVVFSQLCSNNNNNNNEQKKTVDKVNEYH